jgi:hypothetical protein
MRRKEMKKLLIVLLIACMGLFGFAGAASAGGNGPPPDVYDLECGEEIELCWNDFYWEASFKCEGTWDHAGSGAAVDFDDEEASIDASGGENGWADCDVEINLESDDDVEKYEAKCEVEGDKVELEVKNKGECED